MLCTMGDGRGDHAACHAVGGKFLRLAAARSHCRPLLRGRHSPSTRGGVNRSTYIQSNGPCVVDRRPGSDWLTEQNSRDLLNNNAMLPGDGLPDEGAGGGGSHDIIEPYKPGVRGGDIAWGLVNSLLFGIPKTLDDRLQLYWLNSRSPGYKIGQTVGLVASLYVGVVGLFSEIAAFKGLPNLAPIASEALGIEAEGALIEALEAHSQLEGVANVMRTTAVMKTAEGVTVIARAGANFTRQQAATILETFSSSDPVILVFQEGTHAEAAAAQAAEMFNLSPTAIGVSRAMCSGCQGTVQSLGGTFWPSSGSPFGALFGH